MSDVATYCRICEPQCGLLATVVDGRLVGVRGDPDHVHSRGFVCAKAAGMIDVTYDPDRVLAPLRRTGGPGEFEPVGWEEALADIADRLTGIRRRYGASAFATLIGNPPAFNSGTAVAYAGFARTLGVKWRYSINSEDASARMVANAFLYGSVAALPKPDLWRTHFALVLGANPLVSKGSLVSEPRIREALDGVRARGGRVVVVDPRRTETARRYEHLPLRAGTDTLLLLGLLHTLVAEDLVDHAFRDRHTTGYERLVALISGFSPERSSPACGVPAGEIRALARAFSAAPSGVVYGRTGTCTQRFGTLNNWLQDLLMVLTGNVERAGGLLFGGALVDFVTLSERAGFATYGRVPTRVTGLPEVFGLHPSTSLVPDIVTPGEGQVRALMTLGSNPVISSAGGGPPLEAALGRLDLHCSLDLYVNETNRHAHYILPVTGMYERDDVPLAALGLSLRPSIWATEAVIEPRGGARHEWEILDEIARRMGYGGAYPVAPLRWLARLGLRPRPRTLIDTLIRTSAAGDWYGLRRSGTSIGNLTRHHPHGKALRAGLPVGRLRDHLRTPDRRIALAPPELVAEIEQVGRTAWEDPAYPLRLCGMREVRSHNSWMHNSPRLMPGSRRHRALVSPADAGRAGLADGDVALISSASGSVQVAVEITDDMNPGTIALPHGWGHHGGWGRANTAGGVNSNLLASSDPADLERLAGMSILNGIPVRLERSNAGREGWCHD